MAEIQNSATESAPPIELQVREDKLKLLFRQSFPAMFISFATAVLLSWMLWEHVDERELLAWLAVLALATLSRLVVFVTYFRLEPTGIGLLKLERRYAATLLFSSMIWGLGALWVMPADSVLHQAVTMFVLVGMAGGAISVYSARYRMAVSAMVLVLLPSTLWLYFRSTPEQLGMAIGATFFMLASLRGARVLANALQGNFQLSRELQSAHAAADLQAKTDPLTGINNRRAFLDQGEQIIRYCERHELDVCALVMDVDHFKSINDTLGHFAGDMVLRHIGEKIRKLFRRSDVFGRIGGEEFAVILPHTSERDAVAIAEKLRRAIADEPIKCGDERVRVTISIGVADASLDLTTLLVHADKAMYRAKEQGRNQVVCYEESFGAGEP
jgi:diguanylate cyclase (GGDEF)-like protein